MVPSTLITFTPIIKHLIPTTANKHPSKKSRLDENVKNPTGIKLCISHKIATSRGPPLKGYCPNKSDYKNYLQQINEPRRFTPLATITLTSARSYALRTSPPGLSSHGSGPSASSPIDVTSLLHPAHPSPRPPSATHVPA